MSRFSKKCLEIVAAELQPGEELLRSADGSDGLKPAMVALTSCRIFMFRLGTTVLSAPRVREIRLEDVLAVDSQRGSMGSGPLLSIEARSGVAALNILGSAKKEAASWPNWILDAQRTNVADRHVPGSAPGNIVEALQQLESLHSCGALSEEEFSAAKAKLLAGA